MSHSYWVYLEETSEAWMPTRVYMDVFRHFSEDIPDSSDYNEYTAACRSDSSLSLISHSRTGSSCSIPDSCCGWSSARIQLEAVVYVMSLDDGDAAKLVVS